MKLSRAVLVAIILTFIFSHDLIFNVTKPLSFEQIDYFYILVVIKNTLNSILSANLERILTLPIFYGVQGSLAFSDSYFMQSILAFPIFLISRNIILSYNLLAILTLFVSFLSMYILSFYLTKNFFASTLASTIYVFNPNIMGRFPEHLMLYSLEWIPLIFLFLEKSFKNPTSKNIFFFFLFLTCQLLSSLYYLVFLSVILPIYFLIRVLQQELKLKSFLNKGFLLGLCLFMAASFSLGSIYFKFYSIESIGRDLSSAINFSAKPDEFFTAVSLNKDAEHHLFVGWIVLSFLAIGLFVYFKKKPNDKMLNLFLLLMLLSFILSLGPKGYLYSLIYQINPLFSFIRVPSRFAAFFFFFLSLSLALIWIKIFQNRGLKEKVIFTIFIIMIIVEYFNLPLKFADVSSQTRQFYQYIDSRPDIKVIVELPMGEGLEKIGNEVRKINFDSGYLLFAATLHSKRLLNGYSGYIPQDYARKLRLFNTGILNKQKLAQIKDWGVDAIILHKDIFRSIKDFERARQMLNSLGVKEIKTTDKLILFDLTGWRSI